MSESTKKQQYKYSLRTTAIVPPIPNGYFCNRKMMMYPVPPEDAITIENLYVHLKMRFNSGISSGDRRITKIGIANDRPNFVTGEAPRLRTYDVNWSADASRYIDKTIDLSALLKKDDVNWRSYFEEPAGTDNMTYIYIELPEILENVSGIGDLVICKATALYTTLGIR